MRGSIRKRGSYWEYTINLGVDEATGKRKRKSKSGFNTSKECQKELTKILAQMDAGTYIEIKKTSLGSFLNEWLKTYAKVNVAPSTYARYNDFTKTIILHIGNLELSKLKPMHIQNFYSSLIDSSSLSNSTILKIHRMLRLSLKHAVNWQMMLYNPTDAVTPPKPIKKEMSVWDISTANKFLKDIYDENIYIPVLLAITTGMRAGEICALKWDCIDFDNGFLSVKLNFQRVGNSYELSQPKTEKSRRTIALLDTTLLELKKHKKKYLEKKLSHGDNFNSNFICSWDDGTPFRPHYISDSFRNLVSKLKYSKIRFHDLRHTHATLLLSAGINPKIVSERLGHSTISITMDTYSHVVPNMQKEAIQKINNLI